MSLHPRLAVLLLGSAAGLVVACGPAKLPMDLRTSDAGAQRIDAGASEDAGKSGSDGGIPDAGSFDAGSPCASPFVPADDGGCGFGPVLYIGACPTTNGLACVLSFTPTTLGDDSTETITLFNTGEARLHVGTLALKAPPDFQLLTQAPIEIRAGAWATIAVRFAPQDAGVFHGALTLISDAINDVNLVPVEGATPNAACSISSDCLLGQKCAAGSCESCLGLTPPPCIGGQLGNVVDASGCDFPICRCLLGDVYRPGVGCVPAGTCGGAGTCADAGVCASLCCSFPICLCAVPDAGVCAP
jgi:hypothetical protein